MPFTPFHLGPGLAFKAGGRRHVSLIVFGLTQVLMDVEPLVRLWRDDAILHGGSHTYLGATGVALVAVGLGRPLGTWALTRWNRRLHPTQHDGVAVSPRIPWRAAACGAFMGSYSHVLLDSVMHGDMRPWAPFTSSNGLLRALSHAHLHLLCGLLGLGGLLTLGLIHLGQRRRVHLHKANRVGERP